MISVQSHQQPLSGNKLKNIYRGTLAALCLGAVLTVSSCSPKTTGGVLKNPNVYGNKGNEAEKNKTEEEKRNKDRTFPYRKMIRLILYRNTRNMCKFVNENKFSRNIALHGPQKATTTYTFL
jgi:hypothetical protein